ncbi:DUF502 domain-containing protein [Flagellatimonas centrodinii]|uniref:DUF502 domain-containing protein n=1 Tax=Flagellatimonas centrodinii TaxID=2806210 RepID=UPI001FF7424F|nr:DUF502 domain-containing protein [Flagellatimonas centrodinii]ULQ46184.1 DUF502 domain-containing protein [Flagellatimonas centrodinii]
MQSLLRKWFIAGLLVWLPLGATLVVIRFLMGMLDASLILIPAAWRPQIPGLGVILSLVLVLGTGALAANFVGRRALGWGESLLGRIPLIRSVYGGIKKLAETVFSESSNAFRQPIMIEYPRKGLWSIAFVTGEPIGEVQDKTAEAVLTCFVPTTPNPTSGYIVMVPRKDVLWLEMSVEQAMRLIISLGVVTPEHPAARPPPVVGVAGVTVDDPQ